MLLLTKTDSLLKNGRPGPFPSGDATEAKVLPRSPDYALSFRDQNAKGSNRNPDGFQDRRPRQVLNRYY